MYTTHATIRAAQNTAASSVASLGFQQFDPEGQHAGGVTSNDAYVTAKRIHRPDLGPVAR